MAEDPSQNPEEELDEEEDEEEEDEEEVEGEGLGGRLQKVPTDKLFTPGGLFLFFYALGMEILDLFIPDLTGASFTIELIPEVIFAILLKIIVGLPFISQIVPFLLERIPIFSDICPSWVIKMIM